MSVGGIHCRALLDTGAGSSYASEALLHRMGKQPVQRQFKRIEMMMQAEQQRDRNLRCFQQFDRRIPASNRSD